MSEDCSLNSYLNQLSAILSQIAVFLRGMEESGLVSDITEKTHLIGFSLGAHVAGFAGSELKNLSRITGRRASGSV